jgi:succinyl-diaminopimelate desuccinylase
MSIVPDHLLHAIDRRRDDLIDLTRQLVRIPTTNPPGDAYRECAEWIGQRLGAAGFEVEYVRGTGSPGDSDQYPRINVIARKRLSRPGPCVHFNGHIDVVEPGRGWRFDPFSGEVHHGRIYGRGTADMKAGLAAAIIAAETLCELAPELGGTIEISGTVDEESGGYGGVAYLAERGYFSPDRVQHVIIPEPLNVDRVCIGHRGVWWAEIETHGRIAHGSMPFLGDSAIRHMGAVLERLEHDLLPRLAARETAMPVVPPAARHSTLNINSIHGGPNEGHAGLPAPCVVDSCRIVVDRRFLIEESLASVKGEVAALLEDLVRQRAGFSYHLRDLFEVLPTMTDPNSPVVRATRAAIESILGREAAIICSPGTYDQKHIDRIGRLHDCIAYGPGILDLAHQPDEYVDIDDLVNSAKVMTQATYQLLCEQA